jgi:hypothetical protein
MKNTLSQTSELNPPENITPSIKTTLSGILILLPLFLLLIGLYSGVLNP